MYIVWENYKTFTVVFEMIDIPRDKWIGEKALILYSRADGWERL